MSKAYLLVICLLSLSFTGCLDDDETCGTVIENNELIIDEDQNYILGLNDDDDTVESISYHFQRYDDEGHNIDVYVLDDTNRQQYGNDHSFTYIEELSWESTSNPNFERESDISQKDIYYFIVDNSERGGSSPPSDGENNEVHFKIKISIYLCTAD